MHDTSRTWSRQLGDTGPGTCTTLPVERWLAGQEVTVVCDGGLVQLHHRGVLVATHARRHSPDKQRAGLERLVRRVPPRPPQRPSATAVSVTRKVDSSGNVSFAGTGYAVGARYKRRQVQVAVVGDRVEISIGRELSGATPFATTPPATTAPSPTPVVDRGGSMPPRNLCPTSRTYRSDFVTGVPGLDRLPTPSRLGFEMRPLT